jgi:hypothetical protein
MQYLQWVKRFILFYDKRHPVDMGVAEVEAFLTHLAVDGNAAASTQSQALSAILFLYRDVLRQDLVRAKRPALLLWSVIDCSFTLPPKGGRHRHCSL